MPGFVGIIGKSGNVDPAEVKNALKRISYYEWYRVSACSPVPGFILGQVEAFYSEKEKAIASEPEIVCAVDGEIFNLKECKKKLTRKVTDFCGLIIQAYKEKKLEQMLLEIDGEFTVLLFDRALSQFHIITDRLGLRPLYLYHSGAELIFSSELKGFLGFSCFSPELESEMVDCFLNLGHLMGEYSWFKKVSLVSAATIITYDITHKKIIDRKRYWNWGMIPSQRISFSEAVEGLAEHLKTAVLSRLFAKEKVSVTLSGGLDSRCILAAIPDTACAGALTFGKRDCIDIVLASKAAALKDTSHLVMELNEDNWLNGRAEAVWRTDGMSCMLDLHSFQFLDSFRRLAKVNINGFLGDVVAGASYLMGNIYNRAIDAEVAGEHYSRFYEFDDYTDPYYDCEHIEPYLIANRGRRLINSGIMEASGAAVQRKPFMANKLLEFLFSLPDEYRVNGTLYHRALLLAFPMFFRSIPWQKTGQPISKPVNTARTFLRKIKRIPVKLGYKEDNLEYQNYREWMKDEKSLKWFSSMLQSGKRLYRDVVEPSLVKEMETMELAKMENNPQLYARMTTIEIWLRYLYEEKSGIC
ncbi:MAG: hypothetical protein HQK83_08225 [Fibrobacteria bacterium]|nr:hypothetical protein [Fibrobacteria bacterium]